MAVSQRMTPIAPTDQTTPDRKDQGSPRERPSRNPKYLMVSGEARRDLQQPLNTSSS